jgi:hypothetical protein
MELSGTFNMIYQESKSNLTIYSHQTEILHAIMSVRRPQFPEKRRTLQKYRQGDGHNVNLFPVFDRKIKFRNILKFSRQ